MPPLRMWFVLISTLIASFCGSMAPAFAQAMSTGTRLALYAYLTALCIAVGAAIVAARLAWPASPMEGPAGMH